VKRLPWFQFRDHTRKRPWRVWFVNEVPDDERKEDGAATVFRTREILVLATLPFKRMAEVLGHELVHSACAHVTTDRLVESAAEEQVAVWCERSLLPIMASVFGVAIGKRPPLPPFPQGFDAFRRAARSKQ
jgi:hypothetical protein